MSDWKRVIEVNLFGALKKVSKFLMASGEEPSDTAGAIIKAVKKNRFLLVTTPTAKFILFFRRYFCPVWYPLMNSISRRFVKFAEEYRTDSTA